MPKLPLIELDKLRIAEEDESSSNSSFSEEEIEDGEVMDDIINMDDYQTNVTSDNNIKESNEKRFSDIFTQSLVANFENHQVTKKLSNSSEVFERTIGDYQIGGIIGKGRGGTVYKGLNLKNGQFVALKVVSIPEIISEDNEKPDIMREIEILKDLNHPNIIKYVDCNLNERNLYIVLEYMENGSLKDILQKFGSFPEGLVSKYSYQILQGLDYLHDKNILHGDIKGANILITKDGICKLADFGVSMQIEPNNPVTTAVGSPYWMAPELFDMKEITKKSDVWSFGSTVLELLTGSPPYRSLRPTQAMVQIMENDRPPFPPNLSPELTNFLSSIFQKEPNERPSIKELIKHPWIEFYNNNNNNNFDSLNRESFERLKNFFSITTTDEYSLRTMKTIITEKPHEFLYKISDQRKNRNWMGEIDHQIDADSLRKKISFLHVENELLTLISKTIQNDLNKYDENNKTLANNIDLLEDNFVCSDHELAHIIYGDNLSISTFSVNEEQEKGVLLFSKGKANNNTKFRWCKRWVLLKDNFLFIYKVGVEEEDPLDIIKIKNAKMSVINEQESGKKYSFRVITGKRVFYLCAANINIFMKWLTLIKNTPNWFLHSEISNQNINPIQALRKGSLPVHKADRRPSQEIRRKKVLKRSHSAKLGKASSDISIPISPNSKKDKEKETNNGAEKIHSLSLNALSLNLDGVTPSPNDHQPKIKFRALKPGSPRKRKYLNSPTPKERIQDSRDSIDRIEVEKVLP